MMRRGERSSICGCFAGKVSLLHAGAKASLVFWPREMPGHAAHSSQRSSQSMRDSRQSWGWRRGDHQKARDMRPVVSGARYNSRSGEPSSFIFFPAFPRVESSTPYPFPFSTKVTAVGASTWLPLLRAVCTCGQGNQSSIWYELLDKSKIWSIRRVIDYATL
jgi:hypothetical protein